MSTPAPKARLAALFAAHIFSTVAACLGLNALIRSNQSQTALKKFAAPLVIVFDVKAITDVGIVATVGHILMSLFTLIFFNLAYLPRFRALANRTSKLQAVSMGFTVLWVTVCMIPFMVMFMKDSADITGFMGGVQLSPSQLAQSLASSGSSPRYRTMWYLRLLAIFPWFAVVSGIVATFVLLTSETPAAAADLRVPSDNSFKETSSQTSQTEKIEIV